MFAIIPVIGLAAWAWAVIATAAAAALGLGTWGGFKYRNYRHAKRLTESFDNGGYDALFNELLTLNYARTDGQAHKQAMNWIADHREKHLEEVEKEVKRRAREIISSPLQPAE